MLIKGKINFLKNIIHNTNNYLFITNQKTKEFAYLLEVPSHISINVPINEEKFLQKFLHFSFLTKEIFFYELERTYQNQYNQEVELLLKNTTSTTISPLGVAKTNININNEEILENLPTTSILNPHFLKIHKTVCSLKPIKTILLSIMHSCSFLLQDLEEFLILENLVVHFGFLNHKAVICKDIIDGIKYLENNQWIINREKLAFYLKKQGDFVVTFFYWKTFFKEKDITMCECPLVSSKEVEKFTYYNLKANNYPLSTHKKTIPKRHICMTLDKATRILDPKKFYLETILGFKNPNTTHNKEDTKIKTIKKNILFEELNFIY